MSKKVFLMGGLGAGKSTAKRHISALAKDRGMSSASINAYDILSEMYQADTEHQQFRPEIEEGKEKGFTVTDLSVFDRLTTLMETRIEEKMHEGQEDIILIETEPRDYRKVFSKFQPGFFRDAYFLYVDARPETRINRVQQRNALVEEGSHYLSQEALQRFQSNGKQYLEADDFLAEFQIDRSRVTIIPNENGAEPFIQDVTDFAEAHLLVPKGIEMPSPRRRIEGQ